MVDWTGLRDWTTGLTFDPKLAQISQLHIVVCVI